METLKFKTNINCGNCVRAVTPQLNRVDGIKDWQVDTDNPEKILTVKSANTDQQKIVDAVERAGFKATPIT